MNFVHTKIDDICLSDHRYTLIPDFIPSTLDDFLLDSIKRVGILHPPIIKETETDDLVVVNGRQRLLAASKLQQQSCTCLKLEANHPAISTWAIALEDALLSGPLNPIQQAIFLCHIKDHCNKQDICHILTLMGLAPTPRTIKEKEKFLQLEEDIQDAIWHGYLHEKTALELTKLPSPDRLAIFHIIKELKLSASNQIKLTAIGRELSKRNRISIEEVFTGQKFKEILHHPEANIPQKAKMFMTLLDKLRFPQLKGAEDEFKLFVSGLKLPANSRVNHAPAFQKNDLDLTITCSNRNELLEIITRL